MKTILVVSEFGENWRWEIQTAFGYTLAMGICKSKGVAHQWAQINLDFIKGQSITRDALARAEGKE